MNVAPPSYPEMSHDEWFCYCMARCDARDILGRLVDDVMASDKGLRGAAGAVILMRAWCRCDPPPHDAARWDDILKSFRGLDIAQVAEMRWVQ